MVFFLGQTHVTELLDDRGEKSRRYSEIEEFVPFRVVPLIYFLDLLRQALVGLGVLKIAPDIIDTLLEPVPVPHVDLGVLGNLLGQRFAKALRGHVVAGRTDDGELLREEIVVGEIAKRGNEFALGKVAGGAENDHDAGGSGGIGGLVVHEVLTLLTLTVLLSRVRPRYLALLLDVAAELKTHGRQKFGCEIGFTARSESLVQRFRQDGGRRAGLNGGYD